MTVLDWPTTSSPVLDAVPEFYHYEDTGCEVSDACLNCPLPQCKYDTSVKGCPRFYSAKQYKRAFR